MEYFVRQGSIVRKIWGKSDTVLFIFAGSAAEFALNKAVDWLYFTGNLPNDPLGRLFSTVGYAKQIVFAEMGAANKAIEKIASIHSAVENSRGATIPQWAYRDVLFMLIDYSIRSFELLERKLTSDEKQEVFDVFFRVGKGMQIEELPENYTDWLSSRAFHIKNDLAKSHLTLDLYKQYKKHLGNFRYLVLLEGQKLILPETVKQMLEFKRGNFFTPMLNVYKFIRLLKMDGLVKAIILPKKYRQEIKALDLV